jgi:hypothetical protein
VEIRFVEIRTEEEDVSFSFLTNWTVVRLPDGAYDVTIRSTRDGSVSFHGVVPCPVEELEPQQFAASMSTFLRALGLLALESGSDSTGNVGLFGTFGMKSSEL